MYGNVSVWDLTDAQLIMEAELPASEVFAPGLFSPVMYGWRIHIKAAFDPAGGRIAISKGNILTIWDLESEVRLLSLTGHSDLITDI